MIPALILLTQLGGVAQVDAVPSITEYLNTSKDTVAIEAIVKLPPLNPAQRYVLSQAMSVAVQMTPEYGNREVLRLLKTSTRFRLYQAADHLRIGLTVDAGDYGPGLSLLHSVLTEPTFLADTIKARKSTLINPWYPAYRGFESQETPLERETIIALWRGIMRPKNISVAISGRFAARDAAEKWNRMKSGWVFDAPNQLPLTYPLLAKDVPNSPPLLVFDSKPIMITRSLLATHLLAANALGVGKESAQWLVAREGLHLSYRQEAFLIPTAAGWRFRMAFGVDDAGVQHEVIADLRTKLRAKCEALTQADLDHAVGLGQGYLVNQMPTLPMILGIGEMLSNDANDRLYLRHYWTTMYGFDWNAETLLVQMKATTLPELKTLLLQLIDESDIRIY